MNANPNSPNQPYTGQFYKAQQQTGGKTEAVTAGKGAAPSQADQPAQGTKNTLSPEKILTLPKGGGAIKGIGEKFQANPLTGTGTVSVPLPISPGRGDFTPQLALSYDSGSGNSAFGLGFSVGLPSISRKTDKGLPLYHDLEESDVFVMSGAEDLVRLLDASGQKIAPEARNAQGENYRVYSYRPRTEGLFARIERWENTSTGISHWRAVTRDNITTVYGMSSNARITHPGDPVKVFQWMIERTADNRGNLIEYIYKPEDATNIAASVFEDRRLADGDAFNQRYLKKVCYGNYTPSTVVDAPYTGGWHFELILDYGEHAGITPFYDEQGSWDCRTDPFSTFRPGFEVRTYRLCHNIMMFHRFTALGTSPVVVKMLTLDHEQRPELTLLRGITVTGFDGSVPESFPPLSFSYTEPLPATECRQLTAGDIENFAGGDTFRWTDLYGEGLSGVLMQGGEAWYYKPNLGDKRYYGAMSGEEPGLWLGAMNKVASFPNLSKGTAQLGDIDGNGRTDLRVMGPGLAGFTELSDDGKWDSFRPFRHIPNIDMNDPNLKMIDLTGDGHADILITEHQCFTAHYSEAADGFGEAHKTTKPTDEIQGPAIVFADIQQSIYLADMSGDGLTDIVRVRNGAIDYWPNLGYGRFGKRVSMKGAPRFDATDKFEQGRIRLADIDGTGTTDIIYLGTKAIRYWKNMAGNSWSTACEITHFPSFSKLDEVSIMDLLGNGTSCLTAMTPARDGQSARLQYLELTGGQKPFLMYEMKNNMGAVTTLTYAPSTKFYLADRMAGRPWITKLPFPVHVVERTEVHDLPTDTRYTTRYAYHHGYFDGVEREFRGFGMVEQWDTDTLHDLTQQGEADQPPVYTKTWFHTGALLESGDITRQYASEYFNDPQGWLLPDTTLPEGLTATEAREACRALRGSILHQEVYTADGSVVENIPYTTAEKSYAVRLLQPRGTNPHAVFHVTEYDALAYNYERDANNPRVTRQMTLETDAYGNITRSATISYPSRQANPSVMEQSRMLVKYDEISYINEPDNTLFYRLGVPCEQKSYELHNIGQNSLFSHEFMLSAISTAASIDTYAEPGTAAVKRLIGHQQHYFYNTACNGRLPLAQVAAHGLPYHSLTLAWTDECLNRFVAFNTEQGTANTLLPSVSGLKSILTGAGYEVASAGSSYMIRSERLRPLPSSFHQPVEYFDPMENGSLITWDNYKILPVTVTDPIGLSTNLTNDYRVLRPMEITDSNGSGTFTQFSPLGLVTKTAVYGVYDEGDTLSDPTISYSYDLFNWMGNQLPVMVRVQAREVHGGTNTRWLRSYSYSDGLGRELQTKVHAEDGEAFTMQNGAVVSVNTSDRWVATGRTVYNNKGKVIKQYEPWFSTTSQYEPEDELSLYGVTPLMFYDPLGRLIRTVYPDGTTARVEFDAWQQKNFDRNDCVADSEWYTLMMAGTTAQQRAATLTLQHNNTPQVIDLDTLGRPVRVTDDNGSTGDCITYNKTDILGRTVSVTDGKGRLMTRHFYNIASQPVHIHNIDSGHRWVINNPAQKPIHHWDNRSNHVSRLYNANLMPTEVWVQQNGNSTALLIEKYSYGDNNAQAYFRGRMTETLGQEGKTTINEYDFKGNALSLTSQICEVSNATINWNASPLPVLTGSYTQQSTFDAMNRPVTLTAPNMQQTTYTYGKGGLMDVVTVDSVAYISNIDYNARGQRTGVWFGNGSKTRYEYDTDTFRLTRLLTTRNNGNDVLQDITYTFDPEGNIVQQTDAAQQTFYFNNAVVAATGLYEYDPLYRLVKAQGRELTNLGMATGSDFVNNLAVPNPAANAMQNYTQLFAYDELGNLQTMQSQGKWTRNYVYDTATNRLLRHEAGNPVYTYDAHGNMTTMPHLTAITWNYADLLKSATNGTFTSYYVYNAGGDRTRKVVVKGNIREERLYLGNYELYRKYVNNTLDTERQTLHIADDQHRFALIDRLTVNNGATLTTPTVAVRYQYDNHLGSASLELDQNAAIISYEEYHPFGTTSYRSGRTETEVALKRYKYVGKERDEETGLYYYGARYYAAWIARFVSVDPLQLKYPHYTPYQYAGNKPVSYIDLDGLEEASPKFTLNAQALVTYTIGQKTGTSYFNLGFSISASLKNKIGQFALNIAGNLTNGGLGAVNGQTGKLTGNLVISPSITLGTGSTQTPAPLNTFQSGSLTSVYNAFNISATHAQNLVFSTSNSFQRVGAYGLKAGDLSLNVYNDTKKFLGDGGDRYWTGGGSAIITNFLGSNSNSLSFGNDVFTGNSIPDMDASATADALMPTYTYGSEETLHYAGQNTFDQSLNMGQSFLRLNTDKGILQTGHSGKFDMFSQNMIHDLMDFHRFLSTTPNQLNITGGTGTQD